MSLLAEALEMVRGPLRDQYGAPRDAWALPLFRIAAAGARLSGAGRDRERAAGATALLKGRLERPAPGPALARAIELPARLGPPAGPQ
ncbi:hypothetical protein ACGFZK_00235 [Streptomyces sp. NPDC048257]|uniref:hypothetical protein n=1 Tax=Streptomyces sp. NPDC048257 TaxID=3365526 RepID=UPI0037157824